MGASASLPIASLQVEPGSTGELELRVRNIGEIVEEYTFEVVGPTAAWAEVVPPSVTLFPDADEIATVVFSPPRTPDVRAGETPFAVRVSPRNDIHAGVAEEGVVDVGRYVELSAQLVPRTTEGRRRGVHRLAIADSGNHPCALTVTARDADQKLRLALTRTAVQTTPGQAITTEIEVQVEDMFFRGPVRTIPFSVDVQPDEGEPVTAEGAFLQKPVVATSLLRAGGRALLALIALGLLWFLLLRPVVASVARDAVADEGRIGAIAPLPDAEGGVEVPTPPPTGTLADQVAEAAAEAAEPGGDAATGGSGADAGGAAAGGGGGGAEDAGGGGAAGAGGVGAAQGEPVDFRLARVVEAGFTQSSIFEVPSGRTLSLTDIILQNPAGDRGILQVKRGPDAVLIETRMETFRDLDYHFVAGIPYGAGDTVELAVICENDLPTPCTAAAYFAGFYGPEG